MHCGFLTAAVRVAWPGGERLVSSPKDIDMHLPHEAMLLRIFIGETDRWHHNPLYEAIVLKAREVHLAGATVLRGPMGYGKSSRLHTAKILRLSMDLPLVIEIVDTEEKIQAFLPVLDEMMKGGLVTLERVRVIDYRANPDLEEPEI
jgi:PII-like signaling protein